MDTQLLSYYTTKILNKFTSYQVSDPGSLVCEGVYIGSIETGKDKKWIRDNKIKVIINLSGFVYQADVPMLVISLNDSLVGIGEINEYMDKFNVGKSAIAKHRGEGSNVLVHCAAGINRSATIIAFYLIDCGYSYPEAYKLLHNANKKRKLPVLTNESFRYILAVYDATRHVHSAAHI